MAGLGGGVIIKPVLDVLGDYNLSTIGILSSFTVFSMAVVSITRQIKYKVKIEIKKTVLIGIGSIIGGVLGDRILANILNIVNEGLVTIIQNSMLAIILLLVFIYMNNRHKYKSYKVENKIFCILIGMGLGIISSFLNIGGGPINVCVLTIFFSMETKEAAINSVITILFSQGAKLINTATTVGFAEFDLSMLPFMIIGGIIGGLVGSKFNKSLNSKVILKVFNAVVISLVLLNITNIVM